MIVVCNLSLHVSTDELEPFLLLCSGGKEGTEGKVSDMPKKEVVVAGVPDDSENRIQAARERFLARKAKK